MKELMDELYLPKDNKIFEQIFPAVWKKIGLEDKVGLVEFEAFLIELLCYLTPINENKSFNTRKNAAVKRDIFLLTYGLLSGYYHTIEDNGIKRHNENRCKEHFEKSDYKLLHNKIGAHDKAIERCREYVPDFIIKEDKKRLKEFLTAGIKDYTEIDENDNRKIILPLPCFVRDQYQNPSNARKVKSHIKAEESDKWVHTDNTDEESKDNPKNKKKSDDSNKTSQSKLVVPVLVISIVICILIVFSVSFIKSVFTTSFDDPYQKPITEMGKPKTQNNTGKKEQKSTQDNSLGEHKKYSTKVNYTFEFPLGIKFSGEVSVEKIEEPQE